jgi:hypothetical protein
MGSNRVLNEKKEDRQPVTQVRVKEEEGCEEGSPPSSSGSSGSLTQVRRSSFALRSTKISKMPRSVLCELPACAVRNRPLLASCAIATRPPWIVCVPLEEVLLRTSAAAAAASSRTQRTPDLLQASTTPTIPWSKQADPDGAARRGAQCSSMQVGRVAQNGNTVRQTEYGTVRNTVFRWGNTVGEYGREYGAAVDAPD